MPTGIQRVMAAMVVVSAGSVFLPGCSVGTVTEEETSPIPPDDLSNGPWSVEKDEAESDSTEE